MKSTILLSLLALSSSVIAATPPACLLAAVNTEQSPGDLSAVCGSEASKVQSAIASICTGSNVSAAQSAFIATCSGAGTSVGRCQSSQTHGNPANILFSTLYSQGNLLRLQVLANQQCQRRFLRLHYSVLRLILLLHKDCCCICLGGRSCVKLGPHINPCLCDCSCLEHRIWVICYRCGCCRCSGRKLCRSCYCDCRYRCCLVRKGLKKSWTSCFIA